MVHFKRKTLDAPIPKPFRHSRFDKVQSPSSLDCAIESTHENSSVYFDEQVLRVIDRVRVSPSHENDNRTIKQEQHNLPNTGAGFPKHHSTIPLRGKTLEAPESWEVNSSLIDTLPYSEQIYPKPPSYQFHTKSSKSPPCNQWTTLEILF
uniref:Uncharacterized protein n=1 Tax=Compsopogon caeruleus TaxID=31354 RepID=A0A6T6C8M0_9RHOD|mmetsp:Transcript_3452/g.6480  ORF Transcript_3452/g.6480 Transcript_3452/m.6480 type:complete len:150 (+) Transcript_3452:134-583(+)